MPPARSALPWVGLAVRAAAAAVWLAAGIAKLPDLESFRVQVERYAILPHALAVPFAYFLPFLEIGLGAYLLAGLFVRGSALLGSLLLVVFLAAQIQALARGIALDCGCFGAALRTSVGIGTLARDVALGLPTYAMALWPARVLSLDALLAKRAQAAPPRAV